MLTGFWYIATESRQLKLGRPTPVTLLDQPLVLLRDEAGLVHALEDRCPHRGAPLSAGRQEGDAIRCGYHGWKFGTSGTCLEVPSLVDGNLAKLPAARSYPAQEQDGWVWVYVGDDRCPKPSGPPPELPKPPDGSPMSSARQSALVKVRFEFAVDSLVDPAHVPFVHNRFFRQQHVPRLKEKEFTRLPLGFRTVSENNRLPDTFIFRALSPGLKTARTSVDFFLPAIHLETLQVGRRFGSIMLIATPLTRDVTRLDITIGWNFLRWLSPMVAPLVRLTAGTTLGQDRHILEQQEIGNRNDTTMYVGLEMDTLAVWYRRLQHYHRELLAGRPAAHPIPERTTLRWYT